MVDFRMPTRAAKFRSQVTDYFPEARRAIYPIYLIRLKISDLFLERGGR